MRTLTNQKDILYDRSYEYFNEFNCNTDWLDLISRNAFTSTTDFAMDGGGEVANYRFSLNYLDQDGTTKATDFARITSRLNLTIKFSRKSPPNSTTPNRRATSLMAPRPRTWPSARRRMRRTRPIRFTPSTTS